MNASSSVSTLAMASHAIMDDSVGRCDFALGNSMVVLADAILDWRCKARNLSFWPTSIKASPTVVSVVILVGKEKVTERGRRDPTSGAGGCVPGRGARSLSSGTGIAGRSRFVFPTKIRGKLGEKMKKLEREWRGRNTRQSD
jgi:hypothetical protein